MHKFPQKQRVNLRQDLFKENLMLGEGKTDSRKKPQTNEGLL